MSGVLEKGVVPEGYELEKGLEVVEDVKDIGTKVNPQRRDITRFSKYPTQAEAPSRAGTGPAWAGQYLLG
jgi:hypothetical protein